MKHVRHLPRVAALASSCLGVVAAEPQAEEAAPLEAASWVQRVDADWEGLFSGDVRITRGSLGYDGKHAPFEFAAGVALNTFDIDYEPADFDFLGSSTSLEEYRVGGTLAGKVRLLDPLTLRVSGAAYDGFTDYRSIWLNEYYRQQFESLPGYREAEPAGESIQVGLRWEYLPAVGFVDGDITALHDEIAPGYEIDFAGLRRGRPNLYTTSYHVALENVIHPRVRVLNEGRITDTTDRRHRFGYQGSINVALGERWVLRAFGGYTEEKPTFRAAYFGGSLEFEPSEGWLLSVAGRTYSDTGEIENSLFSSAAPGLTAWQMGFGLRHVRGRHSFKAFAAPYFTRYEPTGIGTAFFANLYQDRDWALVQLAYALEF